MRLVTGFSRQVLFVLFGLTILVQTANAQDQRQKNLENLLLIIKLIYNKQY